MLKWGDGGLFTHHSSLLSQHVMVGQLSFWPCQGINYCADVAQCVLQTIYLTCQTVNFCQQSCLVSGKSLYLVVEIGYFSLQSCRLSVHVGLKTCCLTVVDDCEKSHRPNDYA